MANKTVQGIQQSAAVNQLAQITATGRPTYSEIYTKFEDGDIIASDNEAVSQGLWSNNVGILTAFFTSSAQAAASSSAYYLNIYNTNPNSSATASYVQFAIAYGHALGSGSTVVSSNNNDTPTRAIYSQFRNVLLQPGDTRFTFGNTSSDDIYVLAINRGRIKEKLDPGNWELHVTSTLSLIDNSSANIDARVSSAGRIFNVVSGSIANGVLTAQSGSVYGLCYPDLGLIVLDARALDKSASLATETGSAAPTTNNIAKLYNKLNTAAYFAARNEEEISSTHYFVRVKNNKYNFSNNSTFTTGSYGQIKHADFIGDPKVYITTIGLYNDGGELLAVGKLSRPLLKSFTRETLIRVKLDY